MAGSDLTPRRVRTTAGPQLLWGGLGAALGLALDQSVWGGVSGAVLGVLWARRLREAARADALARELEMHGGRLRALEDAGPGAPTEATPPREPGPAAPRATPESLAPAARAGTVAPPAPARPARRRVAPSAPPRGPSPFDRGAAALRELLLGGNTVVRVGVLVLLVGVLLLARWAAENALFPVEARLAAAALIGLALVIVGYRLRIERPGFGTSLQGGGVAALYLVVFVALRIFRLLPAELAFALLVAVAVGSGALAVLQRSQPLIFIGSLGGFLAPVLASTGQGNHVVLFSYYLLLDAAIATVSWFRAWRPLNVLAFVCTYGVATAWGVLRYAPEQLGSTEPFVLAYLVLFTAIAVVFAWRQPPRLTGLIDGTLVFGTALVTLLAQARLVADLEFGMAWSSAGLGLFYAVLGTWLWRAAPDALRRLCEAFVSLAVGFGTLAIPFALDDALSTTMAWALEGAGLYWVGTRQARKSARHAGVALQALAAMAFLYGVAGPGVVDREISQRIALNARFFGCASLAFAGWFIAREAYAARDALGRSAWWPAQGLAIWGLLWWIGGGLEDIDRFVASRYEISAVLALITVTALAQEIASRRLGWLPGRLLSLWSLPAGFIAVAPALSSQPHLLAHGGIVAWPALIGAIYVNLHRLETAPVAWARNAYAPAFCLIALTAPLALLGATDEVAALRGDWPIAAFGLGLAAVLVAGRRAVETGIGPFGRLDRLHLRFALPPAVGLALVWIVVLCACGRGRSDPLPYLPLLNPADAATAALAIATLGWWHRLCERAPEFPRRPIGRAVPPVLGALAFLWLNALLARTVHQWTPVAFEPEALWESVPLQVSLSIAWALVALVGMWTATHRGMRGTWISFSTLLGAVVIKLFSVDLSQLSTGAKIGTFLVVGLLLLVVGYLSPVPPSRAEPAASSGDPQPSEDDPE